MSSPPTCTSSEFRSASGYADHRDDTENALKPTPTRSLSRRPDTEAACTTANFGTQTDNKLLELIGELEAALAAAGNEISELHKQVDLAQEVIITLQEARSKYRNLWMTERRYSQSLEEAGAEAGGYGQAQSSECSSPYYRCSSPVFDFEAISSP